MFLEDEVRSFKTDSNETSTIEEVEEIPALDEELEDFRKRFPLKSTQEVNDFNRELMESPETRVLLVLYSLILGFSS